MNQGQGMSAQQYVKKYAGKWLVAPKQKGRVQSQFSFKKNKDNTYSQLSQQVDALRDDPMKFSLNKGYLELFPQWAIKQKKPRLFTVAQAVMTDLKNENSGNMLQIAKVQPITFNAQKKMWTGDFIQQQSKKILSGLKSKQVSYKRSANILKQNTSIDRINQQLPTAVANVIQASQMLTDAGIGPIRRGGIDLYAGRYFNPLTNRIDVLPKANKALVNPLSYQQNLAYQQAKLLNSWNSYVQEEQKLMKLQSMDAEQFAQKQANKITLGLSKGLNQDGDGGNLSFYNGLKRLYIRYLTQVLPPDSPYYAILPMMTTFQGLLPNYKLPLSNEENQTIWGKLEAVGAQAQGLITTVQGAIQGASALTPERKILQKKRYVNALMRLNVKSLKRPQPAILKAYKAVVIPIKINSIPQAAKLATQVKQNTQKLRQAAFGNSITVRDKVAISSLQNSLNKAIETKDFTKAVAPSSKAFNQTTYADSVQQYPYVVKKPISKTKFRDPYNSRQYNDANLKDLPYTQFIPGYKNNNNIPKPALEAIQEQSQSQPQAPQAFQAPPQNSSGVQPLVSGGPGFDALVNVANQANQGAGVSGNNNVGNFGGFGYTSTPNTDATGTPNAGVVNNIVANAISAQQTTPSVSQNQFQTSMLPNMFSKNKGGKQPPPEENTRQPQMTRVIDKGRLASMNKSSIKNTSMSKYNIKKNRTPSQTGDQSNPINNQRPLTSFAGYG